MAAMEERTLGQEQEGQPQTHNTPDIDTDGSLPVVCSQYHTRRSWSEVSEETPCARSWVKPTAVHSSRQICGRRTAVTSVQLTTMWE